MWTEEAHIYIGIDLKSFYASVECMERDLDPMTTNLVVADASRTEKTICLAVSPSLKAYGISGRARLFEVVQKVREVNAKRRLHAPGGAFSDASYNDTDLKRFPELELSYIVAPPRMSYYIQYSTRIYTVYLKYVAPEDIHVYSIDEVFMDVTHYLKTYGLTHRQLAARIVQDIYLTTGITATAGIGTNLYLCKIALDILAKHIAPNEDGVRVAQLDEYAYRQLLWNHRPITDFWRIGSGYAKRLAAHGMFTMGDVARCSLGKPDEYYNEELLYKLFGVNAELLIDHAWGYEPCTLEDVKAYKPENNSIVSGQVLEKPYDFQSARLVVREMAELLALDLVDKKLVTDQIVLTVGYDIENINDPMRRKEYHGEVVVDRYGRKIPKHANGTANLSRQTSSARLMMDAVTELYDRIVDKGLLVRRMSLSANRVVGEETQVQKEEFRQFDLFTDYGVLQKQQKAEEETLLREKKMQQAMLDIKKKFGKNAILKGMNLEKGATTMGRNNKIGGHQA